MVGGKASFFAAKAHCDLLRLPRVDGGLQLTRDVNEQLSKDADWGATGYGKKGKVSRSTVLRVLELLRKPSSSAGRGIGRNLLHCTVWTT